MGQHAITGNALSHTQTLRAKERESQQRRAKLSRELRREEGVLKHIAHQLDIVRSKKITLQHIFAGERAEVIAVSQRYNKESEGDRQFIRKMQLKENQLRSRLNEADRRQRERVDELRRAREKWKQEVYDSRKRSTELIERLARERRIEERSDVDLHRERADLQQRLREEGKVSSEKEQVARLEGKVHCDQWVEQDLQRVQAKLSQQVESMKTTKQHAERKIKHESRRLIEEKERLERLEAKEVKLGQAGREREKQVRTASHSTRAVEKQVRHAEEKGNRLMRELQSGREEFTRKAKEIKRLLLEMDELGVRKKALRDEVEKEREKEVKVSQDTKHVLERLKEEEHYEAVERAIFARRLANSINVFRKVSRDRHQRRERQAEMRVRERELKRQYKKHLSRYFQKRTILLKQMKLAMRKLGHQRPLLGSLMAKWANISKTQQNLKKKTARYQISFRHELAKQRRRRN